MVCVCALASDMLLAQAGGESLVSLSSLSLYQPSWKCLGFQQQVQRIMGTSKPGNQRKSVGGKLGKIKHMRSINHLQRYDFHCLAKVFTYLQPLGILTFYFLCLCYIWIWCDRPTQSNVYFFQIVLQHVDFQTFLQSKSESVAFIFAPPASSRAVMQVFWCLSQSILNI